MSDPDESELRDVLPRLMQLGNVLNRSGLAERAMAEAGAGLDRPALTVLVVLHLSGGALRVGEIAARMQVAGPHVTRHVHELERREFVRRLADDQDRRARRVEPTPAGTEVADHYLRTIGGWFRDALADWSTDDRRTFFQLLQRFSDDLAARFAAPADERRPDVTR